MVLPCASSIAHLALSGGSTQAGWVEGEPPAVVAVPHTLFLRYG